VLKGGYEEAGDLGRWSVGPGQLLFHGSFQAHLDRFGACGAEILNIELPDAFDPDIAAATVDDPDEIVRLAECDSRAALGLLFARMKALPATAADWPDRLAAALRADPDLRLAEWGRRDGLSPTTLSRGFRLAYGTSPKRFRAEVRARQAWSRIVTGGDPLALLAAEAGFADQAHMTRAVAALTGRSPGGWRAAGK
jgi:AraC-like DNA-binding protein